mmetsp:Transcript_22598/g.51714  ORF Transcript_22598/g.51714 Transcript_22598/m.51714 type:complete len:144 (-) Transcript_22598:38-469(-)
MWRQGSVAFWSTTIAALACTAHANTVAELGPQALKVTTSSFSEWRGVYDLLPQVHEVRPTFRQRRGPGMLFYGCGAWRITSATSFPNCTPEDLWAENPSASQSPLWPMHRDGWTVLHKYDFDYGVWREDPWFAITKYSPCLGI